MHLNHVNLPTTDIPKTQAFLETYFGLDCLGADPAGKIVALRDASGSIVTLSNFKVRRRSSIRAPSTSASCSPRARTSMRSTRA